MSRLFRCDYPDGFFVEEHTVDDESWVRVYDNNKTLREEGFIVANNYITYYYDESGAFWFSDRSVRMLADGTIEDFYADRSFPPTETRP